MTVLTMNSIFYKLETKKWNVRSINETVLRIWIKLIKNSRGNAVLQYCQACNFYAIWLKILFYFKWHAFTTSFEKCNLVFLKIIKGFFGTLCSVRLD